MIKIQDRITTYFDVDQTLIDNLPTWADDYDLIIGTQGVKRIEANINALIQHKTEGDIIVVWSYAGSNWAEEVVKALHLEAFVDLVITKPFRYYDDMESSLFMGDPLNLDPKYLDGGEDD